MTKVIACAHEKGGVGKTTTTVNLGFGLARQGKNVLLLDADPQGDLTKCLGIKNPRELTSTISSVMDYLIAHSDEDAYPDFEYTAPIRQHTEGVDFIPANASLAATEVTLVNSMSRETILRQYLDRVKDEYNYVLIDCRPSLGLTVVNALTAADSVIIPVQAHILAADDMDALFKTIGRVKRNLNPRLQVDGIVMTMVDSRTNLSRNTIRAVRDAYGSLVRVFKSEIPFAIRAAEVPEDEEKLRMLEELMSEDYNELWAELLDVDIYGGLSYEELTQISANLPIGTKGGDIAQAALSKVGTAYSVMDCSQLTQYAYAQAGVSLPRTSVAQAKYCYDNGYAISSVQLQPGDLIFWSKACACGRWNEIHHTGIYIGTGKIVDASSTKGRVVVRNLWGENGEKWRIAFCAHLHI